MAAAVHIVFYTSNPPRAPFAPFVASHADVSTGTGKATPLSWGMVPAPILSLSTELSLIYCSCMNHIKRNNHVSGGDLEVVPDRTG